ncbi:iron export ABC transporter permease subunit FetB [Oscillatoria sp. CS-180]|nr:iron export ABC transporter permease subunit FetB [Oscillatoria sp. CS-180]MDB9525579.1 iron export ABC transporter permease subunit FetB [Oscillatoria sp. CS-180]
MIELGVLQLVLSLGLVVGAIALVRWQNLGMELTLLNATWRTLFQLFAVGYLLGIVFAWRDPLSVIAVLMFMLSVAAVVARNRISKRMSRLLPILAGSLLTSTALTIVFTTGVVIRPDVWYEPRYVIPLTGIVLGNAMTAATIAGDRLVTSLKQNRIEIETHLSLGATPDQAILAFRKEAVKAGLIPTVNAMMVVGIVKLPGIITGQLLSGADPLNAAFYQMLIMFMLAFSDLLASVLVTMGIQKLFFNSAAQLVRQ